jgi:RsiW-degrading membrane proteinase PrsW (M82 family)
MSLVLVGQDAPDALIIGVLLAALPVGPVIASFLWLDRYEPEPPGLLLLAFGWGALVATAAALILQLADQALLDTPDTWSAAVVAPITEEGAKGLFILLLLWFRRRVIDGVLDGLVYAGVIGVGFAFTENILYLGGAYLGRVVWGRRPGCSWSAASSARSRIRCSPPSSGSASASPSSRRMDGGGSLRRSWGTSPL